MKIGFLGAGKMAQALAKGFIQAGLTKADSIMASCAPFDKQLAEDFSSLGSKVSFNNKDIVNHADVLIMAVKPPTVPEVLADIGQSMDKHKLLLSIAMGVRIKRIEEALPRECRIIRVMPNTPALVQKGASVFVRGSLATESDVDLTKTLFGSVGICDEVPEYLLDPVTALSGSGPAFVYVFIEAMADGAVRMGLPRDLAYKLAAQTVVGAATMVLQTKQHPGKLKDDVTSPAGSTAEGLFALETNGFRGATIRALEYATNKCKEVSLK